MGLFASRAGGFSKNEFVTEFVGWHVDRATAERLRSSRRASHVVAAVRGFSYIDGIRVPHFGVGGGSFANDGSTFLGGPGNNSKFIPWYDAHSGRTRVFLKATRAVEENEEIFVRYDKGYWLDNFEEQMDNCPDKFKRRKLDQLAAGKLRTLEKKAQCATMAENKGEPGAENAPTRARSRRPVRTHCRPKAPAGAAAKGGKRTKKPRHAVEEIAARHPPERRRDVPSRKAAVAAARSQAYRLWSKGLPALSEQEMVALEQASTTTGATSKKEAAGETPTEANANAPASASVPAAVVPPPSCVSHRPPRSNAADKSNSVFRPVIECDTFECPPVASETSAPVLDWSHDEDAHPDTPIPTLQDEDQQSPCHPQLAAARTPRWSEATGPRRSIRCLERRSRAIGRVSSPSQLSAVAAARAARKWLRASVSPVQGSSSVDPTGEEPAQSQTGHASKRQRVLVSEEAATVFGLPLVQRLEAAGGDGAPQSLVAAADLDDALRPRRRANTKGISGGTSRRRKCAVV
eukprot:GHVT01085665.1.p1 GENE.GHVT01085665.1~~GHVT01085665.1.p1  ORF type:complete len:520 (-),score=106.77 GHVT01085665.1:1241-2800(-)